MAFQLGIVEFLINELLPCIKTKDKVLVLGKQYITSNPYELISFLNLKGFKINLTNYNYDKLLTSKELFLSFGFNHYDDLEYCTDEGCSIVHNLNEPIDKKYFNFYDLILDIGTIEHIFDMKSVFQNIISMLKVEGTVCHISPGDWINHGLYNFSLNLFYDVYRVNGFSNMKFYIIGFPKNWLINQTIIWQQIDYKPYQLKSNLPKDYFLMIGFIANKLEDKEFTSPIQGAYDPALRLNTPLKRWK